MVKNVIVKCNKKEINVTITCYAYHRALSNGWKYSGEWAVAKVDAKQKICEISANVTFFFALNMYDEANGSNCVTTKKGDNRKSFGLSIFPRGTQKTERPILYSFTDTYSNICVTIAFAVFGFFLASNLFEEFTQS